MPVGQLAEKTAVKMVVVVLVDKVSDVLPAGASAETRDIVLMVIVRLVWLRVPGDTASSLGSAVDELMRHQPSLRSEATKAIIKVYCRLFSVTF